MLEFLSLEGFTVTVLMLHPVQKEHDAYKIECLGEECFLWAVHEATLHVVCIDILAGILILLPLTL